MIQFLKYKKLYFLISACVIGAGLFSILRYGYQYSIDFVGGTNLVYKSEITLKMEPKTINSILRAKKITVIDESVTSSMITVRSSPVDEKTEVKIRREIEKTAGTKLEVLTFETVGPTLGKETIRKTAIASGLAILGILLYMSFAFGGITFAVSAIIAMFHDFLVVVGSYSIMSHLFGAQVDLLFVTAVLTTMSFSVHDTIVIFDKIREYIREDDGTPIEYLANKALTETMVRSFNNSMTILFMLLALLLMGGSTMRFFIATLLIGTITGTYSSPFIATPVLVWLEKRKRK